MRLVIDTETAALIVDTGGDIQHLDLYGKDAFEIMSKLWLKMSWNQKYSYTFTWFGRPIIQHPEDLVRLQEVIYTLAPNVIVETGVAHGGSLVFYASLLKAMGKAGRVVGVDIDIRPHNRRALEAHELSSAITLIEGDSVSPHVLQRVEREIGDGDRVLVLLDSDHSKTHVLSELEAYHHLVTPGSYIVATDGIMRDLHDVPRGKKEWREDNPAAAAAAFLKRHPEFVLAEPAWRFNESLIDKAITTWPNAWLRREMPAKQ